MNERTYQEAFTVEFEPFFRRYGFAPKRWDQFGRRVNDVEQLVSIGPRRSAAGGYGITAGGFGVRLRDVEDLRRREVGHEGPTVAIPLHLLTPTRELREWRLPTPRSLETVAAEIKGQIEEFGLPFLAANSTRADVLEHLEGPDWQRWFVCTPDARDAVRVYAAWSSLGPAHALTIAEGVLKQYAARHAKYSTEIRRAASAATMALSVSCPPQAT